MLGDLQVAIVGHGLLAGAIGEALEAAASPVDRVRAYDLADLSALSDFADLVDEAEGSPDGRLVVTASDGWDGRGYERIPGLCVSYRTSWLPVRTELGRTVIGPLHTPG